MFSCSWCLAMVNSNELTRCRSDCIEPHELCSSCHMTGHACQSSCPTCWYEHAQRRISANRLCSGCLDKMQGDGKVDDRSHRLCTQCSQCLLCCFRQRIDREFFALSYREHEPRVQHVLYHMQLCVQQFEDEFELCSICIEPMDKLSDNSLRTLPECRHRFHSVCISRWLKLNPCCPCCRHVYDKPSKVPPRFARASTRSVRFASERKYLRRTQYQPLSSNNVSRLTLNTSSTMN
jgi:hypothetical protein